MLPYAGQRQMHRARSTGTVVSIYDAAEQGLDTDGGRWATVCEDHATVINHATLALARLFAPAPEEWCEECIVAAGNVGTMLPEDR